MICNTIETFMSKVSKLLNSNIIIDLGILHAKRRNILLKIKKKCAQPCLMIKYFHFI